MCKQETVKFTRKQEQDFFVCCNALARALLFKGDREAVALLLFAGIEHINASKKNGDTVLDVVLNKGCGKVSVTITKE